MCPGKTDIKGRWPWEDEAESDVATSPGGCRSVDSRQKLEGARRNPPPEGGRPKEGAWPASTLVWSADPQDCKGMNLVEACVLTATGNKH